MRNSSEGGREANGESRFFAGFPAVAIFESFMDGFAVVDLSGHIVFSNRSFQSMLGYDAGEIGALGYRDITPERWHAFEEGILREEVMVTGSSRVYEKEYRRKDGSVFPVELRTSLLKDGRGNARGMWAIVRDVSERKRSERMLHEREERFRGVFERSAIGMAIAEPSGKLARVNPALAAMLGYSEEELLAKDFLELTHPDDHALDWSLHTELLEGRRDSFQIEKRYLRADGRTMWGRLTVSALRGPEPGRDDLVIGMVEDVTARKEQQERIDRSLAEKAILLREVHHRVKNNLQLVASMLALQISFLPDSAAGDGVRAILADAMGRVRSMASIHDIIYESEDLTGIDLAVYMRAIASEIAGSTASTPIRFEFDLASVRLNMESAIPCGLLINEALTNIVKHAYPRDWNGPRSAELSLGPSPGGTARISIADRGVGLASDGGRIGLGFTIMRALAEQVNGRLAVRSDGGTSIELEF